MLSSNEEVDRLFEKWEKMSTIAIVKKLYDEVFGRTFIIADPDGYLIRVSPLDE